MTPLLAVLIFLETGATRIGFDPARNGAIASFVDKASGREFVAPQTTAPLLYELRLGVDGKTVLTEADASDVTVKRDGDAVVIAAPRHKDTAIAVECRFRTEPGSPLIFGRIAVRNGTDLPLSTVRFPALAWPKQLGASPDREFLVWPNCDGCLIQSPGSVGWFPTLPYPGGASMQFMAVYDDTAGLYAATYDSQAHTKVFAVEKGKDAFRLALRHLPPRQAQVEWRTEYDVVLGTFRGDWQTAADIYKSWAVKQPWCRRTLAQRVAEGDVPRWLTEPSLFYAYSLRGQLPDKTWTNRLPLVPQQAEAWREVLGGPTTFMLMSWEKKGSWVTPDYFPPFGGEAAFKAATDQLHAKGHRTLVFLSGLKWTLRKMLTPGMKQTVDEGALPDGAEMLDDTVEFEKRGASSAICGPDGQVQKFGHVDPKKSVGTGESAQICPATPLAREMLLGASLECQRLGIDCVQADQIVGGGMPPCYSPQHGHPIGGGNWSAKALYAIFDEIRREGKKRSKDFAFAIEEPGEFFIPVLDTYHARDYALGRWPRDGATTIAAPLFTHVYHEFMHGYGGDSCGVSTNANLSVLCQQAMNLVCGKTPGVAVWTRDYDPKATDATQGRMLRSHFELWRGPAREFLVFGQRMATQPLQAPSIKHKFWTAPGKPPREMDLPAVLHSAWRLPDGRTGTVFACVAAEPVAFDALGKTVTLQPGEAQFIEHNSR
ncbi:MAG: DUF6259 domain-containing protein [Planctomycetota bacterium]